MRSGSTQSSPTGIPYIRFTVGEDTYVFDGSGSRIKAIRTDEQPFGSKYDVVLDNSDGTLTTKEYDGLEAYLSFGFVTETLSTLPKFWVLNTQLSSEDGEMLMTITCIDAWGLMSFASANFVSSYFNQEWQKEDSLKSMSLPSGEDIPPTLITELNAGYNKTILSIITKLIWDSCGESVYLPPADNDGRINTLKPPISVSDPVSGIQQALSLTSCYLLWCDVSGTSKFKVVNPTVHTTVYEYNVGNLFFSNVDSVSVTTPNQVNIWAYDEDGDAWINGVANDLESQGKLGVTIPVHYFLANMSLDARASQAELTSMAGGYLSKVQGERSVGVIVAPMHCSQELFDKISVTDDSYSPSRIVTGYVHRIVREFEAGTNTYRATLQIGGVATGFVPEGGRVPTPLAQIDPPTTPVFKEKFPEWVDILPRAVQGYTHDITFSSTGRTNVTWSGGTIYFYDGTTLEVNAGSWSLSEDKVYYIYFDLKRTNPSSLYCRTAYLTHYLTENTGLLCIASKGSKAGVKATVIPSYGKEPLITCDRIDMSGLKEWEEDGQSYQMILNTQIEAGYLKLTADTKKVDDWYDEHGVVLDATRGISLYGGQIALRTFDTEAHYLDWLRYGTTTHIQCQVASDGSISAGGGNVLLNASGLQIKANDVLQIKNGDTKVGRLYSSANQFGFIGENNKDVYSNAFGTGKNYVGCGLSGKVVIGTASISGSTIAMNAKIEVDNNNTTIGASNNTSVSAQNNISITANNKIEIGCNNNISVVANNTEIKSINDVNILSNNDTVISCNGETHIISGTLKLCNAIGGSSFTYVTIDNNLVSIDNNYATLRVGTRSSSTNATIWYDSGTGTFKGRAGGSTKTFNMS